MSPVDVVTLLRTVTAHGLPGALSDRPDRPLEPAEWQDLLFRAGNERVIPLLSQSIVDGWLPATDQQLEEVVELETGIHAGVLLLEATLVRIAEVLEHNGVRFRVLKGPAVAHLSYPDPALRDFGDIDLLVHPDDLDHAIAVLGQHGYARRFPEPRPGFDRRFSKSVSMSDGRGYEFDLHRTLARGAFGLRVNVDMLWDSPGEPFQLGGRVLHALGPAGRFVHACYHAVLGNVPPRLVPQRDIAQMLLTASVDPDDVRGLAAAWQGEPVVAAAIRTTWETMRLTDVVALVAWAEDYRPAPRVARELARATSPTYTYTNQVLHSVRAVRPRDRPAYLAALAFPRRSYVQERHSGFANRLRQAVTELREARSSVRRSAVAHPAASIEQRRQR